MAGEADRYGTVGKALGESSWPYNGTITDNISLTGAEYTNAADGCWFSQVLFLSE